MISFEAFKILNGLKPTTLGQANWISATIERFKRLHPELQPKINAFYREAGEIEDDREWLILQIGGQD